MLRKNGIFIGMAILIVLIVGLMFSSFPNISGFLSILSSKINFPTIYPDGILTQTKLVTAGNSFFSQSSFEKIFGFGSYKGRVDITVYWPSGIVQQLNNIKLNKRIIITEDMPIQV